METGGKGRVIAPWRSLQFALAGHLHGSRGPTAVVLAMLVEAAGALFWGTLSGSKLMQATWEGTARSGGWVPAALPYLV